MNGFTIKNIIYLLFIATIFYFIVGKIFKIIKFKKLNELSKGIYFSVFILLFYFFYKIIPVLLFGNSKIIEGLSAMDDISASQEKAEKENESKGENIDYSKGWDTADHFRANYCSKTPLHLDKSFFIDTSKETGNPDGGFVYGIRSEIFDPKKKEYREKYSNALNEQKEKGNTFDPDSFTKENGCFTNLKEDDGQTGTNTQLCNPSCRFKFKLKSKTDADKDKDKDKDKNKDTTKK